ncbi:hypothetical protein JQ636_24550 [Bradyrhizobium japonicum]|uniref:hypothetical protein n=1 Tax=Bradyrhizobium japonicum TaxID=375 RepID=UPI001BA76C4E|nr:hypothetical protein [Bradyrhizobium japonicum]MBR0806730.1 hypothetical protein [Bradyrhizobium japonicum]
MGEALDRGYAGEQTMGFWLGERGYVIVDGPSGAKGHAANEHGLDGLAYHPQIHEIILYDNKAFSASGTVATAKAQTIDPTARLEASLRRQITRVQAITNMPGKATVLQGLQDTLTAVQQGKRWPGNVKVAISNAWGNKTGISRTLQSRGITFIDVNQAPQTTIVRAPSSSPVRAAGGAGLSLLAQVLAGLWLADIGDRRLKSQIDASLKELSTEVDKRRDERIVVQLSGEKVFANLSLTISETRSFDGDSFDTTINVDSAKVDSISSKPSYRHLTESTSRTDDWKLSLTPRRIRTTELKKDTEIVHEEIKSIGSSNVRSTTKWSIEAPVFSDEEMDWFRDLTEAYLSSKRKLRMDPVNRELLNGVRDLRKKIVQHFGTNVWYLKAEEYSELR